MRWALVKVCLAVTTMVVVAFAVPLGLVTEELARDRAFSHAERTAAALGPTLSVTTDRDQLARALATAQPGGEERVSVYVPPGGGRAGVRLGRPRMDPALLEGITGAEVVDVRGGSVWLQPIAVGTGEVAVVEVFVPDGELTKGVATAWAVLAGVAVALVIGSVAVADRLGVRMVRPAQRLVGAARDLGEGDLAARVPAEGPTELRLAAVAFNSMADQVTRFIANERELAADLSHRLRTPLTVLRLNAASLGDGPAAEQTRGAVAQLEREVDAIIRTAREARPQTVTAGPGAGCDAAEVVTERMDFWSALAEDEGRAVRVAGVDRPVRVPVARSELAAALDALLGNVFRHTPEGTAFAVDVHSGEDAVIVLVADAGPGIGDPEAALVRGRGSGSDGSTGLGLDIVRRLAESTGGDLAVGSSALGGTEVRIRLLRQGRRVAAGRRGRGPRDRWRTRSGPDA